MKILQVINTLAMGGAEKLISEIVPRLCNMGHEVDVLVFDGTETPFMQDLKNTGIKVISLGDGTRSAYSITNLVKMIPVVHRYDIVHSHTTPAQLYTMLSKVIGCPSVKIVTTEHSTNNHRRGKWMYKITDRLMYYFYNRIICIAETSKRNLENQIGKQNKISVIENGIDVEKYHSARPLDRLTLGIDESDFVMTMVGRFVDAKDQDTIIKAMSMLSTDCKLLLVGSGDRQQECEELAKSLNVKDRVLFLGLRSDVPQILHTSDVVIMSSHWEGLSLSSVEGMSVDKPFVASDVQGLREVVGGAGVLFKEGDYQQLSEEINRLKEDPNYYLEVAEKCLERARQYDISKMVKRYNEVYLNLE